MMNILCYVQRARRAVSVSFVVTSKLIEHETKSRTRTNNVKKEFIRWNNKHPTRLNLECNNYGEVKLVLARQICMLSYGMKTG